MRRLICLFLSLLLLLSVTACGTPAAPEDDEAEPPA